MKLINLSYVIKVNENINNKNINNENLNNTNIDYYYVKCRNIYDDCTITPKTKAYEEIQEAVYSWNNRLKTGYKFIQKVSRKENMSQNGKLELFRDESGDIYVNVCDKDGHNSTIEFAIHCSNSPYTIDGLLNLMECIEIDNKKYPE